MKVRATGRHQTLQQGLSLWHRLYQVSYHTFILYTFILEG